MARPQSRVLLEDAVLSRAPIADRSAAFIVGFFEKGPTTGDLVACKNMEEVKAVFGDRVSYSNAYDAIETIFRLSGGVVYPIREVGPSPVKAVAKLFDASGSADPADVSLIATAKQYGEVFNSYSLVATAQSTNFTISILDENGDEVANSGSIADRDAAVAWSADSTVPFTLALGASAEDPRAQSSTPSTGADDHASATTTELSAALARTSTVKGGFVAAPGQTSDAARLAVQQHAAAYFRLAVLDSVDDGVAANAVSDVDALAADDTAHASASFAPWVQVTGLAAGTTITIPPSALAIGLMRRNDADGLSIAQPAAGPRYATAPPWVTGVSTTFSEANQDTLADGHVNVIRVENGQVVINGARTAVDEDTRPQWTGLGGARAVLQYAAEADALVDSYRGSPLIRDTFQKLERDLIDLAEEFKTPAPSPWYESDNGNGTLDPGYSVDATTVNTADTIAARQLLATATLKTVEAAEDITLTISKQAI